MKKAKEILKKYWGFDSFRPLQEDIVDSVIYGHDTAAILPTGGGKSICFQVPGMALEGLTLVISPLIGLMEDQVTTLRKKGIDAEMITSSMTYREIDIALDNARFGNMKFLYTSPERIKTPLFISRFKLMKIGLIAIDEAHCISEWGHDFRPAYCEIAKLREHHPHTPLIALTASATQRVKKDIFESLELKHPNVFEGDLERKNLSYNVEFTENKLQTIIELVQAKPNETGIIYCGTRRSVKHIVTQLRALNVPAGFYHGGLKIEDRKYMLDNWLNGSLKVMVATNAFGMGIDKPDVRYVLHFEIPNNIEAFYQEAGRAGRDNQEAKTIAYYSSEDIDLMKNQFLMKYPPLDRVKAIFSAVCNFLQVAVGSGDQESYDFDIQTFHKNFGIPITETYYALKILQLNETINFDEAGFHSTRLRITVGNSTLYKFQVSHDKIMNLVALLTRSYPGIFDRFININEYEFAKRLKISRKELTKQLLFLEEYGVIDINFQSNLPKITLTGERLPDSMLAISPSAYLNRKAIEEEKLNSMIHFITSNDCRSELIIAYFNGNEIEPEGNKCGKCDNCIRLKQINHKLEDLTEMIKAILPGTLNKIMTELNLPKEIIAKGLHHLILEEEIIFKTDTYSIRKKNN